MGDWYIVQNGSQQGPVSEQDLRRGLDSGEFPPDLLVWTEGMGEWQSAQSTILSAGWNAGAASASGPAGPAAPPVRRSGELLVIARDAVLPDFCIKTNLPAQGNRFRTKLYWHAPAWYLLVLVGLLVYVVAAIFIRKSAAIDVGLSPEFQAKRRRGTWIATLVLVAGGFLMFLPAFVPARVQDPFMVSIIVGVLVLLTGLIWMGRVRRVVAPTRIDDTHVWLRGAHPDFLDRFPAVAPEG